MTKYLNLFEFEKQIRKNTVIITKLLKITTYISTSNKNLFH